MVAYVKERYTADNVLIAAAGALEHQQMVDLALRWLGDMSGSSPAPVLSEPAARPGHVFVYRKTEQAQVCLSLPAFAQGSDDNYPLIILDTVLGGGPHSRLFDEIRENRGLAYNVGSGISSYAEGGAFSVYASSSPRTLLKVVQLIHDQIDKVAMDGLTDDEIELARQHIRASWLLANEGTSSKMGRIANSQLYFDRVVPFDEVIGKLDAVTGAEVLRVARQVLNRKMCATAVVGPIQPGSKAADRLAALAT
jgi:predicted Zn-dependent peptidase